MAKKKTFDLTEPEPSRLEIQLAIQHGKDAKAHEKRRRAQMYALYEAEQARQRGDLLGYSYILTEPSLEFKGDDRVMKFEVMTGSGAFLAPKAA